MIGQYFRSKNLDNVVVVSPDHGEYPGAVCRLPERAYGDYR